MTDRIPSREISDWAPDEVSEIDLYEKREKIYTRKIEGFFQKIRVFTGWPLLLGYLCLPWIEWHGRQSVLFDLPARKFHILGLTFWPQDMSLLGLILIIAAFALFLVTALLGRVWCGYSCPQTVWTAIFMWCEQKAEGTRNQRIKLDNAPWDRNKILRKSGKYAMWLAVAFVTGLTFVGYFTPIRELSIDILAGRASPMAASWVLFFTCATFINAGYLREQLCKYICPYARFQSVMFDSDTLIVSYDTQRGEPRGSRKRQARRETLALGDCVDCQLCVQVCPVGIDIRDGLQYQCIACALCIDACDSIMEKLDYPKGLIRYTTENHLRGQPGKLLRPRTVGYAAVLLLAVGFFAYRFFSIEPIEIGVIRDREYVSVTTASGAQENRYILKIANKTSESQAYTIRVEPESYELYGQQAPHVASGEVVSVRLRIIGKIQHKESIAVPVSDILFIVTDKQGDEYSHASRFIGRLQ